MIHSARLLLQPWWQRCPPQVILEQNPAKDHIMYKPNIPFQMNMHPFSEMKYLLNYVFADLPVGVKGNVSNEWEFSLRECIAFNKCHLYLVHFIKRQEKESSFYEKVHFTMANSCMFADNGPMVFFLLSFFLVFYKNGFLGNCCLGDSTHH